MKIKIPKFNIVCVDADDLKTLIIATYDKHQDAMECMTNIVHAEFTPSKYLRIYNESPDTISIWVCGYLYGKKLKCKYHILHYEDSIESDNYYQEYYEQDLEVVGTMDLNAPINIENK